MTENQSIFYGIDYSEKLHTAIDDKLKDTLRKLTRLLLYSDTSVDKTLNMLDDILDDCLPTNDTDPDNEEIEISADDLHLYCDILEEENERQRAYHEKMSEGAALISEGIKSARLQKLLDWVKAFSLPTDDELNEYFDEFKLDKKGIAGVKSKYQIWRYSSPLRIKSWLNRYVIGQENAKETLSWAFYNHFLRTGRIKKEGMQIDAAHLPKSNILLMGPSGSGKTYMVERLAGLFQVPFVKVDCAGLVASGYVGNNLSDAFGLLVHRAGGKAAAEKGVIFFDEFDKMSERRGIKGSVGGQELQTEFLTILQNGTVTFTNRYASSFDERNRKQSLSTENILFILGGAFEGVTDIVRTRSRRSSIGFKPVREKSDGGWGGNTFKVTPDDLKSFGLLPELINRISYCALLHPLSKNDIVQILSRAEHSLLDQFKAYFSAHGKKLVIDQALYEQIAERVVAEGSGAGKISVVLHEIFREKLFECPETEEMEIRL